VFAPNVAARIASTSLAVARDSSLVSSWILRSAEARSSVGEAVMTSCASDTTCPYGRADANTQREPESRRHSGGEPQSQPSEQTTTETTLTRMGRREIIGRRQFLSIASRPMASVFSMYPATFRNGQRTAGTSRTLTIQATGALVRAETAPIEWCVAAHGAATHIIFALVFAAETMRAGEP